MNFIKKHAFVIVIAILLVLFIVLAVVFKDSFKTTENQTINNWYEDTKNGGYVVTVLAQTTCSHCKNFQPVMDSVQSEYGFKMYWIDIDTLNSKDSKTVLNTYDTSMFSGTPFTMVTYNGELKIYTPGEKSREDLVQFLKDAGVIESEEKTVNE